MEALIPRLAEKPLREALTDTPVVLLHGPRQCGKTTLAKLVGDKHGYTYLSFDDEGIAAAATADPIGFVNEAPRRTIFDEVQRVPQIFPAIKLAVDKKRTPGQFLLTGSANVLLVPKLSESLAGRLEILRLHPLCQAEIQARKPSFIDALFSARFKTSKTEALGRDDLARRICTGGFPVAAARKTPARRTAWLRDYINTLIQRDVRDLARIANLDIMPRLLSAAAAQTATLTNISDLASPFSVSRPTIRDYITLLEHVFLLDHLAPWHMNNLNRLVKTPKLHMGDTGLAAALLGHNESTLRRDPEALGPLLETFVYQELRRQASVHSDPLRFFHYRDKDKFEVDIVVELGPKDIVGVKVKAAASVQTRDFRGLRKLRDVAKGRLAAGVVLYDGATTLPFGDGLFAVPIRRLWEG